MLTVIEDMFSITVVLTIRLQSKDATPPKITTSAASPDRPTSGPLKITERSPLSYELNFADTLPLFSYARWQHCVLVQGSAILPVQFAAGVVPKLGSPDSFATREAFPSIPD